MKRDDYGTDGIAPHSVLVDVQRDILTDGSAVYNVIWKAADGPIRFGCETERAAWDFADHLSRVAWIES